MIETSPFPPQLFSYLRMARILIRTLSCAFVVFFLFRGPAWSQESPYIVTYDHYLEEPGNLEVEYFSTFGTERRGNNFNAHWLEFEYGAKAWWTTELYLDGQTTFHDSSIFTGFRWENRFRPFELEHFVNPILYVEYEQISDADKIIKEVEGRDVESDHADPNALARQSLNHELEFKLLLSKTFRGWNVAVNPLATKNLLPSEAWEFGYAIGASRPLALKASAARCNFCRENLTAGLELYGGLGDTRESGLHETSHYLAPAVAWNLPSGWTVRFSPGFGLNDNSHRFLLRWGLSREFDNFGDAIAGLFGGRK
ncbi:MAG: hypothetical protein J2P13_10375 [Acidobacteria bacterium]|nr:hypothetical protein [Acidobacteriota bacterium]